MYYFSMRHGGGSDKALASYRVFVYSIFTVKSRG